MQYFFNNPHTDPYMNMAVEEFLFLHYHQPVFHLWQNEPCVVIGKNQLLEAEIDPEYARQNNIKIVRRFSGGGAVYQDLGNLNLSFITSDGTYAFDAFNRKIMDFLQSLHLTPTTNERRAIFINELKISGSSQHIRGSKSIYHATLLFNGNLNHLEQVLKGKEIATHPAKYVKSVKSPVTNLGNLISENLTIQSFADKLLEFFTTSQSKEIKLSAKDLNWISTLKSSKYESSSWIQNGVLI